ncbi:zinc finger protein RFP-like [Candoia aspera]|uniref:zinc finger protein RFP-like n=1 Tax=Candoia aspera TaxID=51853 RepID=UPI002FD7A0A2
MAAGYITKKLQSEITCFVCLEYLIEPVTLDCGHNFCHACIVKCWGHISGQTTCPRCRTAVPRLNFKPNGQLANVVRLIRQLSDQTKQMARTSKTCKRHEMATLAFCRDDLIPICLPCDRSQEHQAHDVVSVAEAAEEYKQLVEAEKKKVMDGFEPLRQLEVEQCSFWLTKVEEMKTEIMLKMDERKAVISKELFALEDIIQDLVEKHDQPTLEFLQDVQSILEQCKKKKKFESPVAFPPEIEHEIWGLQNFSAFLPGAVKQFEENTTMELNATQLKRVRLGETFQGP